MIQLAAEDGRLAVRAEDGDLDPRHESQMAFWGFRPGPLAYGFVGPPDSAEAMSVKIAGYLERASLPFEMSSEIRQLVDGQRAAGEELETARAAGRAFKDGCPASVGTGQPSWQG